MLCDAAGSIILTTASPDSFMCITCPQCEPALICDKNGCGGPVSSGGRLQIPIELHHALACLTVQPESCSGHLMESTLAVLLLFLLAKEAILVCSMQVCSYAKRSDKNTSQNLKKKQARIREEQSILFGHYMLNHSLFLSCLLVVFPVLQCQNLICTKVGEMG